MKIKTNKEMNLPELIEWLLKSRHHNYIANSDMGNTVRLSRYGAIQFSNGTFFPEETFTVETEEEITENTVIPYLYYLSENNSLCMCSFVTITELKTSKSRAFYIMNDDLTMTLIWTREKGLVG